MPGPRKAGPEEMPDAGPHLFTLGQNLLHWIRSIISCVAGSPTQSRQEAPKAGLQSFGFFSGYSRIRDRLLIGTAINVKVNFARRSLLM